MDRSHSLAKADTLLSLSVSGSSAWPFFFLSLIFPLPRSFFPLATIKCSQSKPFLSLTYPKQLRFLRLPSPRYVFNTFIYLVALFLVLHSHFASHLPFFLFAVFVSSHLTSCFCSAYRSFLSFRRSLPGYFWFKHDCKLALRSLTEATAKKAVHGVFPPCILLSFLLHFFFFFRFGSCVVSVFLLRPSVLNL